MILLAYIVVAGLLAFKVFPYTMNPTIRLPQVIQGGMGIRISSWQLAREVSRKGELGVISGTAIDTVLVRTLQDGENMRNFCLALFLLFGLHFLLCLTELSRGMRDSSRGSLFRLSNFGQFDRYNVLAIFG